jgi:hypothetical protein
MTLLLQQTGDPLAQQVPHEHRPVAPLGEGPNDRPARASATDLVHQL